MMSYDDNFSNQAWYALQPGSLVDNDFYELKLQDNTDLADLLSMPSSY